MKTFEIDFGGNVLTKIVIEDNVPKVEACINGWGHTVDIDKIKITEIEDESK